MLLFTLVPYLSGTVKAASRGADAPPITGTLVATPQNTLPTMLFLQVGSQTILVNVTASTQIQRDNGDNASLSDLRNGDQLDVYGPPNAAGGINATLIRDLSLSPAAPPGKFKVTGVLGATPSPLTLPLTICVAKAALSPNALLPFVRSVSPCPSGQLPVVVTADTALYRNDNSHARLYELRGGDALTITGSFSNATFTAEWLQDGSLTQTNTTITSTVQSVGQDSNVSTITDVGVMVTKVQSSNSPISVGAKLMLPITDSNDPRCQSPNSGQPPCTRVIINGAASNGYSGTGIDVSDTAYAWGVYNTQLNQFEYVKWLDVVAPSFRVEGNLAAPVQSATAPATGLLCLSNASIVSTVPRSQVATVSPCNSGWLPVYVTASTRYLRGDGTPYSLGKLMVGDKLSVTGYFAAGQFTARVVKDLSQHAFYTSVVGEVKYVSFASTPTYFTLVVKQVGNQAAMSSLVGQAVTVDVTQSTKIKVGGTITNDVKVLNPGQTVKVVGYFNSDSQTFRPTLWVTVL
jgi:hypothetical protein